MAPRRLKSRRPLRPIQEMCPNGEPQSVPDQLVPYMEARLSHPTEHFLPRREWLQLNHLPPRYEKAGAKRWGLASNDCSKPWCYSDLQHIIFEAATQAPCSFTATNSPEFPELQYLADRLLFLFLLSICPFSCLNLVLPSYHCCCCHTKHIQ